MPRVPAISLRRLEFELDRESWSRRAALEVTNPGEEAVQIAVKLPARVEGSSTELKVPAGGTAQLELSISAVDVGAFQ